MVTSVSSPNHRPGSRVVTALLLAICSSLHAQDDHAYAVGIKLRVGGKAIGGFLHSVNDSAVTILPGRGGRKGLEAAMARPQLISIPTSVIKKLAVVRVRRAGSILLSAMLLQMGYSIAYVLLVPIETTAGFVLYTASVTTATLLTLDLLYVSKYKPDEPGFTITMQKYCLVRSGIVADGQ